MGKRDQDEFWFPRKSYGWGWGLPLRWQGWLVLLGFIGLMMLSTWVFPPDQRPLAFGLSLAADSVLLIVICWLKGERPRWQWGGSPSE